MGRENEPPTNKRSRENEPDPPREDGRLGSAAFGRYHCPEGCPLDQARGRITVAVGASLLTQVEAMKEEKTTTLEKVADWEVVEVLFIVGIMLMAVGATMVVKWTAGGVVGSVRRMKVIEPEVRIRVDQGAEVLRDQWGRKWKLDIKDSIGGLPEGLQIRALRSMASAPCLEVRRAAMSRLGRGLPWLGEGQARGRSELCLKEKEKQERFGAAEAAASESSFVGRKKVCNTAWNQFQHDHSKKGWSMTRMRQEYYNQEKNEKKG